MKTPFFHPYSRFVQLHKYKIALFFLWIGGTFFRIHLAVLFVHTPPIADEKTYLQLAQDILRVFWVAECCTRGYVYPFFLAGIFQLFGTDNLSAVVVIQSLMDASIVLPLFFLARKLGYSIPWAFFIGMLYAINPLTGSYSGLIVTETLAFFCIVWGLVFLVVRDRAWTGFCSGICIGLAMFNRLMFFYWGIGLVILLFLYTLVVKKTRRLVAAWVFSGMVIISLYAFIANWLTYQIISPLPMLPAGRYDYLISYEVDRWPILLDEYYRDLDPIIQQNYQISFNDKDSFIRETDERMKNVHARVRQHPVQFIENRLSHIPNFWDKRSLCCYKDPFFPADRPIIQRANIVFLFLAGIGVIGMTWKKKKTLAQQYILLYTVSLVGYLTLALTFRVPEERHTMPAYPLLLLFLPWGILSVKRISIAVIQRLGI